MEYCLGSITLEVLWHINSFLKQYTGFTGILLSAGSKLRAVNPLKKILSDVEKSTERFAQLWSQEVPTLEEFQVSLQVNIGPNYLKAGDRNRSTIFFLWSLRTMHYPD